MRGSAAHARIGAILLEKGCISPAQIEAALETQLQGTPAARRQRLGQILVDAGAVNPTEVLQALAVQGKTPMRCASCNKTYNVKGHRPGMRALCPGCRAPLVIPNSLAAAPEEESSDSLRWVTLGEEADPALLDLVPGYRLERRLGSGGMGAVYLARQAALDRLVAVKLLAPHLSRDERTVRRFLEEARSATRLLPHANIVAALDSGEVNGSHYFVMEYVEGETLGQVLRREGRLGVLRTLELARQVACGLRQARVQGLIHRDIKPDNIMVTAGGGTARICDFGLARDIGGDPQESRASIVLASPAYASPEQCRGETNLDPRTDMYSLGVTMFEMLTGRLPFADPDARTVFARHVSEPPPAPRSINPAIPRPVEKLILRLLRKRPGDRFDAYDDLIAAIDAAEKDLRRRSRLREGATAKAWQSGLRAWILAGGAAIVVAILVVALSRGREDAPPAARLSRSEELFREALRFQRQNEGRPAEYAAVGGRWAQLEVTHRGTPEHARFVVGLHEFDAKVAAEAEAAAAMIQETVRSLLEEDRIGLALARLRAFPSGYESTSAYSRMKERAAELEDVIDERYRKGKEVCLALASSLKLEEARRKLADLVTLVKLPDSQEHVRPHYASDLESLGRRIEAEYLVARKKKEGQEKPARWPVPSPEKQREIEKVVREVYREDYLGTSAESKRALAAKLIKNGIETQDPPVQFVHFREAVGIATEVFDLQRAYLGIDSLAQRFEVNPARMKHEVLTKLEPRAQGIDVMRWLAVCALQSGDDAVSLEDFEIGQRAVEMADRLAQKAKDPSLDSRVAAVTLRVRMIRTLYEDARQARPRLVVDPLDPAGNLAVGRYECWGRENWQKGLVHLNKGSDPGLRELADWDLSEPSEPRSQAGLGDAWWRRADSEAVWTKSRLRMRAGHWYDRALPHLAGFDRARAEKRLAEIRESGD